MIIKASANLRNSYSEISDLARDTRKPIYITRNGESDAVFMNVDAFEEREQRLALRERIIEAEEQRLRGEKSLSTHEARAALKERVNGL